MTTRLRGLVAATYTPFKPDGSLDLAAVPPLVTRLLADGVDGLYVCGSTGEGVSLSTPERKQLTEAFVAAAADRVPVVVQVGHNSLAEACDLAAHAQAAGADATSAMPPSYFKPGSIAMLVECCAEIAAAAPDVPFYYYHIPTMTGVGLPMVEFLRRSAEKIPNLAGLKYTASTLHEYQECVALDGGRFDVLYGFDELLLPALAVGAAGAVGSTFNIAAPLYRRVIECFARGDIEAAREAQLKAVTMITTIARHPFHPAMKVILGWLGTPVGSCRPPLPEVSPGDQATLRAALDEIGFFNWARPQPAGVARQFSWVSGRQGAAGVNRARRASPPLAIVALTCLVAVPATAADTRQWLDWQPLPPLPDPIGVAGPFVGTHRGGLVVAGGANFTAADAADLWAVPKRFQETAFVLTRRGDETEEYTWQTGFALDRSVAYGASASTPAGIVCAGGEDGTQVFAAAFLLTWDPAAQKLAHAPLPPLPVPSTAGGAAVVGGHVYVVAGQEGLGLDSATNRIWRLALDALGTPAARWEPLPPVPGGPRAFAIVAAQHDGVADCLYVIGGRRQKPGTADLAGVEPLADCHEFSPARHAVDPATGWRRRTDCPAPLMAGTAAAFGRSHLVVLAAADAESLALVTADPEFAKRHPGFPRQAWDYHTITDTWTSAGETPACPVTTPAVAFDGGVVLVGGETRPRVRSREAWRIRERAGPAGREVRHD